MKILVEVGCHDQSNVTFYKTLEVLLNGSAIFYYQQLKLDSSVYKNRENRCNIELLSCVWLQHCSTLKLLTLKINTLAHAPIFHSMNFEIIHRDSKSISISSLSTVVTNVIHLET